jgi:hypothetical protein
MLIENFMSNIERKNKWQTQITYYLILEQAMDGA